jgi:hypothetical protein
VQVVIYLYCCLELMVYLYYCSEVAEVLSLLTKVVYQRELTSYQTARL